MTVGALEACSQILFGKLRNANGQWGANVWFGDVVKAGLTRPYVHYFPASNLQPASNPHHKKAELLMSIKGVAIEVATALSIQEALTLLLDDSGSQDLSPRLLTHSDWVVTTVTCGRAIWLQEYPNMAGETLYHAGHQYTFMMERR